MAGLHFYLYFFSLRCIFAGFFILSPMRKFVDSPLLAVDCLSSLSPSMVRVRDLVIRAARSNINVCIYGQTGTGKEVVARRIHDLSSRASAPFVAVNVAAIPSELVESAFFGHEKGAFTGAMERKVGFFEAADKGTLFLDEVGEMDWKMQTKLLRVLQEGVITRVGGTKELRIDVRIITATHVDLNRSVLEGRFREDLFYRLMGVDISLPALCERREDVLGLAEMFVDGYCVRNGLSSCVLSNEVKELLLSYSFPGNVRELKVMMERAVVLCDGDVIRVRDCNLSSGAINSEQWLACERSLEEYERLIIEHFLRKYDNKVRVVAERLKISKTKIYNLLQDKKFNQI